MLRKAIQATIIVLGTLAFRPLRAADAVAGPGPEAPLVQPSPLSGLWAISIGGDFAFRSTQDLQSFYAPGSLDSPAASPSPGFYLQGRRHISEAFFASAGLTSLTKGYTVNVATGQDLYEWDAVLLTAGGGWMLYRALNFGLSAQAEVGWLGLTQGSFEHTGTGAKKGAFEGSAIATQFSVGGLWFILPSVAVELNGGYRFARLPLRFSDSTGPVSPAFAPEFYSDMSGPYARAGLSFFWGLRNPWGQSEAPPPPKEGPPVE